MKKTREDNTVSVVQRAVRHYGIKVTGNSVKETLKSSSYYPTFRSICDAFSEWKIEHYPLKYDPQELRDLKSPYITHFNSGGGQIAFVAGHENGNVVLYDSYMTKKKIGWDEYLKKSSGAIIVLNPDDNSGEKNYGQKSQEELLKKLILPAIMGVVALVISVLLINKIFISDQQIPWQQYLLIFTKFAGIFFSSLLLIKEYEINMPLAEKLCHISKTINCNSVLNDKAAMVFGTVGWADIGMIYFTGCLLVMLQGNFQTWNGFLIVASAFSLPYTVYSVWYQGFKLRKWCPLCLMVQVILVVEFLIQAPFFRNMEVSISLLPVSILTFVAVAVTHVLINLYLKERRSVEHYMGKLQRFKKNPDVFRALLSVQKRFDIQINTKSLLFGQKKSKLTITAFLSLNCSHCAKAFAKISDVLQSAYGVQVNIILVGAASKILDTLFHLQTNGKENEALRLLDQWYRSDHLSRSSFTDDYCLIDADEVSHSINSESQALMKRCEVTGTPTFFINGYRLPPQYEIDDIKYFSEILSRKEVLT